MPAKISQSVREEQLKSLPGKLFVHWVEGYQNAHSKAVMLCSNGHEWAAAVDNLIRGKGCPHCAKVYRYSEEERKAQLGALTGVSFVRWDGKYVNAHSKAIVRCEHGHEWSASLNNLIAKKSGCPTCSSTSLRSSEESEALLNALRGMVFVRWDKAYKNANSKAVMRCELGHEWAARLNHLLNSGTGCPSCAPYSFNPDVPATLYALRSECGQHVKIGITGHLDQRLAQLKRATPFEFSAVALVKGEGHNIRDLEATFHRNFRSSGFTGFDGATEWLKFDPNIPALMKILGA